MGFIINITSPGTQQLPSQSFPLWVTSQSLQSQPRQKHLLLPKDWCPASKEPQVTEKFTRGHTRTDPKSYEWPVEPCSSGSSKSHESPWPPQDKATCVERPLHMPPGLCKLSKVSISLFPYCFSCSSLPQTALLALSRSLSLTVPIMCQVSQLVPIRRHTWGDNADGHEKDMFFLV